MSGFFNPFLRRVVFLGTPEFAANYLEPLLQEGVPIVAVFTGEAAVSARGNKRVAPPVKQTALQYGVPVFQPRQINRGEGFESLARYQPDLILLIAYGKLLREPALELPRYGAYNLHPSLLPRYRGAAPIQRCLLNGDNETGVCLMKMSLALDEGPVARSVTMPVSADQTYSGLVHQMRETALPMLLDFLRGFDPATVHLTEQDPAQELSYAAKVEKEEWEVRWADSSQAVHNRIRAFDADPLARTAYKGVTVKLAGSRLYDGPEEKPPASASSKPTPGTILDITKQGARIACGMGSVIVGRIQFPGKSLISTYQATQGRLLSLGERFEGPI